MYNSVEIKKKAEKVADENKKFLAKLKKAKPTKLDEKFHEFHQEVFDEIDCLECANCCKTTSPIFKQKDIERLAAHLKQKPIQFIEQYLQVDEDKDYVLKSSPCTFLGVDNYCSVYSYRPEACREYPHTDRRKMHQVLDLAYKNTFICPAVQHIVDKLKKVTF
jgi:uncharacterized protein